MRMLLLLLLLLAVPAGVQGQDYHYMTNNSTIAIVQYIWGGDVRINRSRGVVEIPDKINDLPVTRIMDGAFSACPQLINVTIPNRVISIGSGAFWSCGRLANITIPDSVTSIGNVAFAFCTNLTSITIPKNVTYLGDQAFAQCPNLTTVNFQGNAPSRRVDVFTNSTNATIYYLPTTTGWGKTFGGRPTAVWKQ